MAKERWQRAQPILHGNNIISSDFANFKPQPWKFEIGEPPLPLILSYEYERLWIKERNSWSKRQYPAPEKKYVDYVGRYIKNFKKECTKRACKKKPKEEKKPFIMKKFQRVNSSKDKQQKGDSSVNKPSPGDPKLKKQSPSNTALSTGGGQPCCKCCKK